MENKTLPPNWKTVKLGEVCEIMGGYAFSSNDNQKNGIRWIKIADVGFGQIENDNPSYLSKHFLNEYKNFILNDGDVIVALTRPIINNKLKIAKINKDILPALLNQRVGKILAKQNDINFIYYLISNIEIIQKINSLLIGTDPPNLSSSVINEIYTTLPPLPEQIRIANCLSKWDKAIETLKKLIEAKKKLKKGLMQRLLSPKNPLAGFEGVEWSSVVVGDIFKLGRGRVISKKEIDENQGIYSVYSSQTSNNGEFGKIATYDFEGDYVTWTTDGANAGTVFYRTGKFNCTNVCGTAKAINTNEIDHCFCAYYLSRIANRYVSKVGNDKLMNNVFAEIPLSLPPLFIQQHIATILSKADEEIELLQKKLNNFETQKKGLMQILLSGKVRFSEFIG